MPRFDLEFIDSKDKAMVQPPHGMNVPGQCIDWLTILVRLTVHHSSRAMFICHTYGAHVREMITLLKSWKGASVMSHQSTDERSTSARLSPDYCCTLGD
jgi:hypothetical protein